MRSTAEKLSQSSLKAYKALALQQEIEPSWPLPLPPPLPQNKHKHTLLLDIDETLIHTFGMRNVNGIPGDPVLNNTKILEIYYMARPFLKEFLLEVMDLFEVIFWTAGTASYGSAIIDSFERELLGLKPSFYAAQEMAKEMLHQGGAGSSTSNANFYFLSRTQTLENQGYMKYIPMVGRPTSSAILIDDNVRSFPLTPRSGVKIACFEGNDQALQLFSSLPAYLQENGKPYPPEIMSVIEKEIHKLEEDRELLNLLPLLRSVAKEIPYGGDVRKELDHWRDSEYTACDNFSENMNLKSTARNNILGKVLSTRAAEPIPAFHSHLYNAPYVEAASAEIVALRKRFGSKQSHL